jgi:hypothetical protein
MPGVPRELVEHALNVDPKAKPVKQPLRRIDKPKRKAIASELHGLENMRFIREINSSTWISNPVIVPKKNTDVQRVCCRGDDFWGMPRDVLSAGWHPRNLHDTGTSRPASPEGPAVPAAGCRLH